jgi:hypothetical protein
MTYFGSARGPIAALSEPKNLPLLGQQQYLQIPATGWTSGIYHPSRLNCALGVMLAQSVAVNHRPLPYPFAYQLSAAVVPEKPFLILSKAKLLDSAWLIKTGGVS